MDDLTKCLYSFVLEKRMGSVLEDREYQAGVQSILRQEDKVRAGMDEKQRRELNALLNEVSAQNALENEHLFQAALGLARELNALVRT